VARPCKSAKLLTDYSQTKGEIEHRVMVEEKLRGKTGKLVPPEHLTDEQADIFSQVVKVLEKAKILGAADTFLLERFAVVIQRLRWIDGRINDDPELLANKTLLQARKELMADFMKICTELSLSPQSRAKIGNLSLQAEQAKQDPLLKVLSGGAE
jgi:P27 family predicted phage terminase small subunit